MDEIVTIVLSSAGGLIAGALGVGASWAALKSQVSSLGRKLTEHEERFAEHDKKFEQHTESIHKREIEGERLKARVAVLDRDGEERAIGLDKLEAETSRQTDMLMSIQRGLGRVVTPSQEMRATVPRNDPVPARQGVPPMRQRLKSQRGEPE